MISFFDFFYKYPFDYRWLYLIFEYINILNMTIIILAEIPVYAKK